jgi:outer membrane receptor for ferrienterochelin and colicins
MRVFCCSILNGHRSCLLHQGKYIIGHFFSFHSFLYPVLIIILFTCHQSVSARQAGGIISGVIYNAGNGEAVAGAAVFLEPGNQFRETDSNGHFQFDTLVPGRYHLLIQRIGYLPDRKQSVLLRADQMLKLTIRLEEMILQAADSISVTARRNPYTTMLLPASRDVVNEEQLKLRQPLSLAEALQTAQGSFIKDYGSFGSLKTVSLRGSAAEQVIIMLDGQKMNDPQTGQVDLSLVNLDGIRSVEILRGGSSALYGADAVGGVINIISKKPAKNSGLNAFLDLMGASFHTASLKSELGVSRDWFSGRIGIRRLTSNGDYEFQNPDGQKQRQENNDITSTNLYTNFDFHLGDATFPLNLTINYRYLDTRRGIPGSLEMPQPTARQWDLNQQLQATLEGKIINAFNRFSLRAESLRHRFRYENDDGLVPVDSRLNSGNNGLAIGWETILTAQHALAYGAGVSEDWLQNQTYSESYRRYNTFAYLQDEATFLFELSHTSVSAVLTPAFRFDHYSDSGFRWSPKLGGAISSGEQWQTMIRFNLGWSYRVPTFNELYWPADPWSKGNAALQPESGFDWDFGLNLRYPILNGLTFDITYFAVRMQNLILWQPAGQVWQPENISRSLNEGIELSSSVQFLDRLVRISGNYTYLEATNQSEVPALMGNYLIYRPRHTFTVSAQVDWQNLQLNVDHKFVGKRYVNAANTIYVTAYHTSDVTFRWRAEYMPWQPAFMIQIKNLFNQMYEVIRFQPMPGREVRVGISIAYN